MLSYLSIPSSKISFKYKLLIVLTEHACRVFCSSGVIYLLQDTIRYNMSLEGLKEYLQEKEKDVGHSTVLTYTRTLNTIT